MDTWERHFKKGKDQLSKHNPQDALKELQIALEMCSANEQSNLANIMFYIGITLKKLGIPNGAVKSWVIAQKLNKSGYAAKMVKRFVNDYGMLKQKTVDEDDWKAFHAIQLEQYLRLRKSECINDPAEFDVINEIISDAWIGLCQKDTIHSMGIENKLNYFKTVKLVFPVNNLWENSGPSGCIPVDFTAKQRLKHTNRCFCGSGLPYGQCCGRTVGEDELRCGAQQF